jgi:hypothetical protein
MAATTLTISDQTATGKSVGETVVEFLTERITVRELIRSRVYQEVQDYNRRKPEAFRGLVQPDEAERALNGDYRMRSSRDVDWRAQFERACDAFERNGFFVLVNDRQAETLEEEIVLGAETRVAFVKLVPLVGG